MIRTSLARLLSLAYTTLAPRQQVTSIPRPVRGRL
jgi:hypothetical protein